ncbi:MAG: hypothetical protein OEW12_04280 [Deltaproteobacteria bacterium]|nr:hypothetical protein [Deltaproteobacteria bacterium]
MGVDPNKWTQFDLLTPESQKRIGQLYPYLKPEQGVFSEKLAGVFIRNISTGKVEKLLEMPRKGVSKSPVNRQKK